jgi:hypothetical protein
MNTNKEKSGILRIFILVISLIVIAFSSTYAYYTAVITGEDTVQKTSLSAANLDLTSDLDTVSSISNSNIRLINASDIETQAEKVTFTVTNSSNSTVSAKYNIYLTNITLSKNLYSEYFKWELLKMNGDEEVSIAKGDFSSATEKTEETTTETTDTDDTANTTDTTETTEVAYNAKTKVEDIKLTTTELEIEPDTTDTLIFRIWLENDPDVNQINLSEGSFAGRLSLEAVPYKTSD